MKVIAIDCSRIRSIESFHDVFAKTLGFPEFYGHNMDAWIDCMSDLDGMTSAGVQADEMLVLDLKGAADFKGRCPMIFLMLNECTALVNHRRMEVGEPATLSLAFSL